MIAFQRFLPAILLVATASITQVPPSHAANIIGFANNPTSCGGSTLSSVTTGPLLVGTQGYATSGVIPFNLSTINSWFQIDLGPNAVSHLPNQPAEPSA